MEKRSSGRADKTDVPHWSYTCNCSQQLRLLCLSQEPAWGQPWSEALLDVIDVDALVAEPPKKRRFPERCYQPISSNAFKNCLGSCLPRAVAAYAAARAGRSAIAGPPVADAGKSIFFPVPGTHLRCDRRRLEVE